MGLSHPYDVLLVAVLPTQQELACVVCLLPFLFREMETQSKIEQLKNQRRQERSKNRLSALGAGAVPGHAGGRLSAAVVSYKGGHALPLPASRGHGASGGPHRRGPRRPRDSIILNLTRAFRIVGNREGAAAWVEERLEKQREKKRQSNDDGISLGRVNGVLPSRDVTNPHAAAPAATEVATRKQPQHTRRQSEALRMTRRPPGAPMGPNGSDTPVLLHLDSPRGLEMVSPAMFG